MGTGVRTPHPLLQVSHPQHHSPLRCPQSKDCLTEVQVNPFARHSEHSSQSILLYRITTFASYLILLITAFYYSFHAPTEGHKPHDRSTIWGQNRPSPFAQNSVITSIYWIVLWLLQLIYAWSLWSSNETYKLSAANIGAHYIASNLLLFGFLHLFVRSYTFLALLLLVINFFNLSTLYFRHSTTPRLIHIGVVSGPLAWNFVALYWVGALAVHAHNLPARIVGNIFIWGFLAYGVFFLAAFKDYTVGFSLSVLSFCTCSPSKSLLPASFPFP